MSDRDSKTIQALIDNGSDISKSHEVDFFLDFNTFEEAAPVAQFMEKDEFSVKMFQNEDGTYTIEAKKSVIPTLETMSAITTRFNDLTEKYGGNYDGWGTEIVE